jgi:anti-sigma B factor antagonist
LDIYTAPDFREHLRRYDPAEVQLVIDLAQVSLLDSAGIGGLVSLRNEAHRAGAHLGLICPQRRLTRLFRVTGLSRAFALGGDLTAVRDALAARRLARVESAGAA